MRCFLGRRAACFGERRRPELSELGISR
jgi:hypothetical protein